MINKIFSCLLIIFISCENKNNLNNGVIEIDMSLRNNKVTLCSLSKEIQMIELESTTESLIGHIEKIKIVNGKIFIHDLQTRSILVFEYPSGKFISKIQAAGNEPGSFSSISAFDINAVNQNIYILDGNRKRLLTYKLDGKYVESKELPVFTHNFSYLNNSFVFFNYSISNDKSLDYQIILTNTDLTIQKKAVSIKNQTSINIKQINRISNYTSQSTLILPKDIPYAYEIKDHKISPKYYFNFKKNWDDKLINSYYDKTNNLLNALKKNEIVYGLGVIEGEEFLEIDYWLIDKHFVSVYNKKTGKLYDIEQFTSFDFFPRGYYNGFFISVNYLQDLSHVFYNKKADCLHDKYFISTNKNDTKNPILILAKF